MSEKRVLFNSSREKKERKKESKIGKLERERSEEKEENEFSLSVPTDGMFRHSPIFEFFSHLPRRTLRELIGSLGEGRGEKLVRPAPSFPILFLSLCPRAVCKHCYPLTELPSPVPRSSRRNKLIPGEARALDRGLWTERERAREGKGEGWR